MLSRHEDGISSHGEIEAATSESSLAPALCSRCQQLCEWAPSYFKAARRSVSEGFTELRRHRAEWAISLERELARERHRLRRVVEDELEVLLTSRSATSQARVPPMAHRRQKQQQRQQEHQLQCGFVTVLDQWA